MMLIKRQFVTAIAIAIVLLAMPSTALAQGYSFSLEREKVNVFLNEDGSISLDYMFVFINDWDGYAIDFVDVGMPNSSFDIGSVVASVNDTPVKVSEYYQGNGYGFAVVLGNESIQPGQTGIVRVTVPKIIWVLNRDTQDAQYASFEFSPTWFDSEFVRGNTDLTVSFHLPPGVQPEEPRYHVPKNPWTGPKEPTISLDENGQIAYAWHDEIALGYVPYVFGASFPLNYVPAYATQLAQPTPTAVFEPAKTAQSQTEGNTVAGWIVVGITIVLSIGAVVFLNHAPSSRDYVRPQIFIEGYGIKRGLTAVEAAVVLEQPLDKILTTILFGVVKKGAAKIVKRDPLQLDIVTNPPEDLYEYEKNFLDAFRSEDAKEREGKLHDMFITLIKSVSEKMRGFSRDETQAYYRDIMKKAWQQVQEANTPEIKNQEFDKSFDWLMLNHNFGEDVQGLFKDPGMKAPQWWSVYDQSIKLPESHLPTAVPASSALPGADYAASIVNSVQDFSSRAISDIGNFTEQVHKVTNLQSIYSYDEEGPSVEGFLKWFVSSNSSSSSHHHGCACACAGCACACAGGGR